jgi:predicted DNA-binding transcriptional regulator YafY
MTTRKTATRPARDYATEDASRERTRLGLRLTDDEATALRRTQEALAAPTQAKAVLAALAAVEALLGGATGPDALEAARVVARQPPPKPGWRKGRARG